MTKTKEHTANNQDLNTIARVTMEALQAVTKNTTTKTDRTNKQDLDLGEYLGIDIVY